MENISQHDMMNKHAIKQELYELQTEMRHGFVNLKGETNLKIQELKTEIEKAKVLSATIILIGLLMLLPLFLPLFLLLLKYFAAH